MKTTERSHAVAEPTEDSILRPEDSRFRNQTKQMMCNVSSTNPWIYVLGNRPGTLLTLSTPTPPAGRRPQDRGIEGPVDEKWTRSAESLQITTGIEYQLVGTSSKYSRRHDSLSHPSPSTSYQRSLEFGPGSPNPDGVEGGPIERNFWEPPRADL